MYEKSIWCCLSQSVPPRIIPFHFEEHIRAGSLVQVICVVGEGDAPIDIRWTLHGEEVRPKLGIFTQRVGERTSILSIDRVGSEHRGSYTCLASNHAGRTNHTETLWVNGTPAASLGLMQLHSSYLCSLKANLFNMYGNALCIVLCG